MKILEITNYQLVCLHTASHIKLNQAAQMKELQRNFSRDKSAVKVITINENTTK